MPINLLRSTLHNIGVLAVGFLWGYLGSRIDAIFNLRPVEFPGRIPAAVVLLAAGFLLRLWATFHFYDRKMRVISLEPQSNLIVSGPYRFSRNPLYLGGNIFIFFGASLLFGSPGALAITVLHLPLVNWFIGREERQLEETFGEDWRAYKRRVRRWI